MEKTARVLLVPLLAALLTPAVVLADGMFVVPKFVWDKHKDINEPTQKAILVYDAGREDLILQVKYEGPVDEFGWLIPVPNLPTVQKGSMGCFYELSQYTQKQFETEWGHNQTRSIPMSLGAEGAGKSEPPVKVVEIKTVGVYKIAILSTKDSNALEKWLNTNQFYFPTNKTGVLDAYVKQQWYFVAVKINLKSGLGPLSTFQKLAGGELNPLQISFASDRCVFPLKISSVNGQPSEVQVYVLSPEPLLEKTMFDKKQAKVVGLDAEREVKLEQSKRNLQALRMRMLEASLLPSTEAGDKLNLPPEVASWNLLPYGTVTEKELPQCGKAIPRFKSKTWWLTKQTWTFQPTEMQDLEFQPAVPALAEKLNGKEGYFAAANLVSLGTNGATALLSALHETNEIARLNVASVLDQIQDARVVQQLDKFLTDLQPEVRARAIFVAMNHWNSKSAEKLIGLLRDPYREIRHEAGFALRNHRDDLSRYIPEFRQMLQDTNLNVRTAGMNMLYYLQVPIPREQLLEFFKLPDREAVSLALAQVQNRNNSDIPGFIGEGTGISDTETVSLLQNTEPLARLIGLKILYQNAEKQSIELAMPLLNDPERAVRMRAAGTLRALTGQHFTEDQTDEWKKWWTANKTNFVLQLNPEELLPQHWETNDFRRYPTNRPFANLP
jgi:hypothetical protein